MEPNSKAIVKTPTGPDVDASAAYSRLCSVVAAGETLPKETVAAWG